MTNPVIFAAEEGGGSFLVTPGIGLMIWTLVVFGVSMYILAKVAFPRIGEALDKRQKAIEDSIETSERVRKEAEQLLEEYRERLAAARGQADDGIDEAWRVLARFGCQEWVHARNKAIRPETRP